MRSAILVMLCFLPALVAAQKEESEDVVWYCQSVERGGLEWNPGTKQYDIARLNPVRYVIKQRGDALIFSSDVGMSETRTRCEVFDGLISCQDDVYLFVFNPDNGKATMATAYGWLRQRGDGGVDTLSVAALSCENF